MSRHYRVSKDHENQMGENEVRFTAYIRHVLQCCQLHFGRIFNFPLLFYFPFVYSTGWMQTSRCWWTSNSFSRILQWHPKWKWGIPAYHGQSADKRNVTLCLNYLRHTPWKRGGSAGMAPLFLTLTEDGVASFRHLLLYPMGKEPQIRKTGDWLELGPEPV